MHKLRRWTPPRSRADETQDFVQAVFLAFHNVVAARGGRGAGQERRARADARAARRRADRRRRRHLHARADRARRRRAGRGRDDGRGPAHPPPARDADGAHAPPARRHPRGRPRGGRRPVGVGVGDLRPLRLRHGDASTADLEIATREARLLVGAEPCRSRSTTPSTPSTRCAPCTRRSAPSCRGCSTATAAGGRPACAIPSTTGMGPSRCAPPSSRTRRTRCSRSSRASRPACPPARSSYARS